MAVGIYRASLLQTSAVGMSGYFTAMPFQVISLILLSILFRYRRKVAKSSQGAVMEPLLATGSSHGKRKSQRHRKRASRDDSAAAKLQTNVNEPGVHQNDSAFEDTDIETASCKVIACSNKQLEAEADMEANSNSSTADSVFTPPTNEPSVQTLTTIGEAAQDASALTENDDGALAHNCAYKKHLLLRHRDIAKMIAQGPPGLELDPKFASEQRALNVFTLALSSLARRRK